jgi:hypothetical protein
MESGARHVLKEADSEIPPSNCIEIAGPHGANTAASRNVPKRKVRPHLSKPISVFQSSDHTLRTVAPLTALQRPNFNTIQERNFRQYSELCGAYFEERDSIPPGNLHEVRFEDLEKAPIAEMAKLYEALGLPSFDEVRDDLNDYVSELAGYQRNRFPDLPESVRARIAREWNRSFEEWGYDPGEVPV